MRSAKLSLCLVALGCAACTTDRAADSRGVGIHPAVNPGERPIAGALPDPGSVPAADAPTLVVSPLTRIGTDAAGSPAIVLHLELRDAAGLPARPRGGVRVELPGPDTPTPAPPTAAELPERIWEIDLRDQGASAAAFDALITRTYVLPLTGLPDWLIAWSQAADEPGARTPPTQRPEIRVWFTIEPDPAGAPPTVLAASRRLVEEGDEQGVRKQETGNREEQSKP